jgi:radical SAM superfamily enzyme YgiQ (UPF0313 family)
MKGLKGRIRSDTAFKRNYDLVGVTGYNNHYLRAVEIAELFHRQGILTVVGGPGVSGMPERYREYFDVLFIGEAERTWPEFILDWEKGIYRSEYRQIQKLDLDISPLPNWNSIASDMQKYAMGGIQTSRGCPFDCEFCDVIYLFGRKVRHKPIENIIEEVKNLERLGVTTVIFCDDEFIGDPEYTKELLTSLIPVNNSFRRPLTFITQISMVLSRHDEILKLLADANFGLVFIGIETPNKASLKETGKFQNIRKDLIQDVRKILSYGIAIRAGLIVGFDHDTIDVFQVQNDFVHRTFLPSTTLSLLKAIPGTRLWRRLRQEGRVLDISKIKGDTKSGDGFKVRSYTNVVPKSMSRIELMQGFRDLSTVLYSWESYSQRMRGFLSNINRCPKVKEPPLTEAEIKNLKRAGGLDTVARKAIEEIISHTSKVAPFMIRKVRMLTLQHAKHKLTFDNLRPYIERLINLESSGEISFDLDTRPVPIPENFRASIQRNEVFSGIYQRVFENLHDKSRVTQALNEVFVDFLARWADGFHTFQPQHKAFLEELCDRTCKNINDKFHSHLPNQADIEKFPSVKYGILVEDILRNVEQELIKLGGSSKI